MIHDPPRIRDVLWELAGDLVKWVKLPGYTGSYMVKWHLDGFASKGVNVPHHRGPLESISSLWGRLNSFSMSFADFTKEDETRFHLHVSILCWQDLV